MLRLQAQKFQKIDKLLPAFPERFKGGIIEKWKNYCLDLARDYKVTLQEITALKNKPVKAAFIVTTLASTGYCVKTNPTELDYKIVYMNSGLDLLEVSDTIRSSGSENLYNYISKAYSANLIRRLSLGIGCIIWVDDYSPELGLYAAQCDYMKPSWMDMRYRILDIGFIGRWWLSHRKMLDYDVNENEWTSTGDPVDAKGQLKQMW